MTLLTDFDPSAVTISTNALVVLTHMPELGILQGVVAICIAIDDFCIKCDDFCIKNGDFYANVKEENNTADLHKRQ